MKSLNCKDSRIVLNWRAGLSIADELPVSLKAGRQEVGGGVGGVEGCGPWKVWF